MYKIKKDGDDLTNIEKRCLSVIEDAANEEASDIHFQPKRKSVHIQFRIRGEIQHYEQLSEFLYNRMLSHFKFQANMDIGEKRKPQNGALTLSIFNEPINIRLSTVPTPYNESLVLRLLPQKHNISYQDLFLFPESAKPLLSYIQEPHGLILLTGPTGAGKSTTIYSLLQVAATTYKRRILTIEDPIEIQNDTFTQMEVNEKAGITFSEGVKASLRQDPDIILVGEVRDEETAKIAVKAALSGHLIVTTMHAKNTLGAIYRLLNFGIPLSDIQQTLIAIATQKLITPVCERCGHYCNHKHHKLKRLALIEMLSEQNLTDTILAIQHNKQPPTFTSTLQNELAKAIEYGFLLKNEKEKWIDIR